MNCICCYTFHYLQADVIVNTTNLSLDLRIGTVSRSLIKEGGDIIMQELKRKYPDGIQVGKIARSSGGNLQCKEIYHGVLNKWDQGQGVAERVNMHAFRGETGGPYPPPLENHK